MQSKVSFFEVVKTRQQRRKWCDSNCNRKTGKKRNKEERTSFIQIYRPAGAVKKY